MGCTDANWTRALLASTVLLTAAGAANAQEDAASSSEAPETEQDAEDEGDDLIVTASPDQMRIDRRTYTVRDAPDAQSSNMLDILGRIPAVSIAPSGEVRLLGSEGVAIQINGQPVPSGSLDQVLRTLTGENVERIEVITNPSAQYAAQGVGGIINIITRDRYAGGLGGSLYAGGDTLGGYNLNLAPSWTGGPWSLSGRLGYSYNESDSAFERRREVFATSAESIEAGNFQFDGDVWYGGFQTSYRPNARRRFNLYGDAFETDQNARRLSSIATLSDQTLDLQYGFTNQSLTFDYQQDGAQPREVFKVRSSISSQGNTNDALVTLAPPGGGAPLSQFARHQAQDTAGANVRVDYERPFENERFLTIGFAFDHTGQDTDNSLLNLAGAAPPSFQTNFTGNQQTYAAYGTYQFATGDWTWLPGLRAESYRREVVSSSVESDTDDVRLFPSLHIRRKLSRHIDLDLSYSSRIQRPDFQQLDPTVVTFETRYANSGNPNLEPSTTDAYEVNLTYQGSASSFSLTFYDRISDDIFSYFTDSSGPVAISMPVNAGTSEQRGLQAILRGPLWERWRYSVSANLLNREFNALNSGVIERRSELEYSGNAQIEYRDANQSEVGADHLQFELQFQGPRHQLQSEVDEFTVANFTWRRRLTDRVAGILSV